MAPIAALIDAADDINQVQGVIAHELGHITGGHIIRQGEGAKAATNISLLSLLAGLGGQVAVPLLLTGLALFASAVAAASRTRVEPPRVS